VTFFDFSQKGLLIDVATAPTTALALGNGPLLSTTLSFSQLSFMEPLPSPLSSRAKPRDLQFRGPFLETRNPMLKQNCYLDRTRISCHAALDIAACAAFVKESSMKCANATKFNRKSGVG
jgi:hypothetical protein